MPALTVAVPPVYTVYDSPSVIAAEENTSDAVALVVTKAPTTVPAESAICTTVPAGTVDPSVTCTPDCVEDVPGVTTMLFALDGVVAEVGVHLHVLDAAGHFAVVQQGRAEGESVPDAVGQQLFGGGDGFVVDLDGAVAIESQALAGAVVAEHHAVADHDACIAEAVVVAVDGEDGVVCLRGCRGGFGDVFAEAVVGEG